MGAARTPALLQLVRLICAVHLTDIGFIGVSGGMARAT